MASAAFSEKFTRALTQLDEDREALHILDGIILSEPARGIKGDTFRCLLGPCVYVFYHKGTALYIGRSNRGLSRVSARTHAAKEAIETCDDVHFYPCASIAYSKLVESKLIRELKPAYNTVGKGD